VRTVVGGGQHVVLEHQLIGHTYAAAD
jgi:hypothetical protein